MEMSKNTKGRHTLRMKSLAALLPLLIAATSANAVQTGQVTAGQGSISSNGPTTTINQQSDRMIVHWNNFDIAAGEQVQFNQPSATSAVLNRVNSANATQIDGALNANGRVFVVNPNGIVVGKTGSINANGVVLSSLNIFSETDFMSPRGLLRFFARDSVATSSVVNEGIISAGAAGVSLFGQQVVNASTGRISASGNETAGPANINLIASNAVDTFETLGSGTLSASGYENGRPGIDVIDGLAANDGAIRVDGGTVRLAAVSARGNTSNAALRNTGSIEATTVDIGTPSKPFVLGGTVYLKSLGRNSNGAQVGGSISASDVIITAQNNTVIDGAIKGEYNVTADLDKYTNSTLTVADNATLNGGSIRLTGDNVAVNGQVTATRQIDVTGYVRADVRNNTLDAPAWTINDGGKITNGSGQN